jgi:hypothetical protein
MAFCLARQFECGEGGVMVAEPRVDDGYVVRRHLPLLRPCVELGQQDARVVARSGGGETVREP